MKNLFFCLLFICASVINCFAQGGQYDGNWFDGHSYYTSVSTPDGNIRFQGVSADGENRFSFYINLGLGNYIYAEDTQNSGFVPIRAEYDNRANFISAGGATVLAVYDQYGQISWVLEKTTKSKNDCLASQLWWKDQPIERAASGMIMNTDYLATVSKTELRYLQELLTTKSSLNYIEKINSSIIGAELEIPDYTRYNINNIEVLKEIQADAPVTVYDAVEFISAIVSGKKEVVIGEGAVINLSDVLNDESYFSIDGRSWVVVDEEFAKNVKKPTIISEPVYDGGQLTIAGVDGLTIKGTKNSRIIVNAAYAYVLNFVNCTDIKLENVTLGHNVPGYCMGGVVGLYNCQSVTIEDSDLYGCGAYGIVAENSEFIRMNRSFIRDCSYGIMQLMNVQDVVFNSCDFFRNKEYTMIEADAATKGVVFEECRFAQNQGVLFIAEAEMKMINCEIYHPFSDGFGNAPHLKMDDDTVLLFNNYPLKPRKIGPVVTVLPY